ncbi:hypothetical protein TNCV_2906681 [Trichonephila clavipes]|nr:hypothetical protein TNCV_2906681 [Trichonephila clavipes]
MADRPESSIRAVAHYVFPALLLDVLITIRNRIWFQPDGTPAHFSTDVRAYLNATFGARWIVQGEPFPWLSRLLLIGTSKQSC